MTPLGITWTHIQTSSNYNLECFCYTLEATEWLSQHVRNAMHIFLSTYVCMQYRTPKLFSDISNDSFVKTLSFIHNACNISFIPCVTQQNIQFVVSQLSGFISWIYTDLLHNHKLHTSLKDLKFSDFELSTYEPTHQV